MFRSTKSTPKLIMAKTLRVCSGDISVDTYNFVRQAAKFARLIDFFGI